MTAFLLDANVLFELVRPAPDRRVLKFLSRERDLWLSVVSLHEISFGAARVAEAGRRQRLTNWIDSIKNRFKGRFISVDEGIAESARRARGLAALRGQAVAPIDTIIAATATSRLLVLATRNISDFASLEVGTFDPWSD